MLAYTRAEWVQNYFQDERGADNLYYMGFIFTVCTLGVSLFRFSTQKDVLTDHIVGDLGIGLSTTVLGLFLRVLFLRRETPEHIENRVHQELTDVAEATVARIRETADVVEEGQIATRQALEEMNTSVKAASDKLVANTNILEKRISDMINIPPDLLSSQLSPALASASQSITRFTHQMDNIEIPGDLILSRISEVLTHLAKAMADLTDQITVDIHKHLSGIFDEAQTRHLIQQIEKTLVERFQAIEIPAELLTQRIEPVLDQVNSSTRVFVNRMQNLSSSLEDAQQQFSELSNKTEALLGVIENSLSELDGLKNSLDALLQHRSCKRKARRLWRRQ